MECVEIWECFAHVNYLWRYGACGFNYIGENSHSRDWGVMWVRVEEGELGELWKCGDVS